MPRDVVPHAAGERHRDAQTGQGYGRGGRRTAATECAVVGRDALVPSGQPGHDDDRVERGVAEADDLRVDVHQPPPGAPAIAPTSEPAPTGRRIVPAPASGPHGSASGSTAFAAMIAA